MTFSYPTDWEITTIGDFFDVYAGGDWDKDNSHKERSETYKYPVFANAHVGQGIYGYANYWKANENTITVTGRGDVGLATYRTEKYVPIVRLITLDPKDGKECKFFSYFINNRIEIQSESTGVPQLTAVQISKYLIPVPKLNERISIAKALSDIDELIAVTAQLLNKKERIFEGALQTEFTESSGATLTMVSDVCEVTKGSAVKYDKDFVRGSFGFLNGGINFSGSTEFANDSGDTVVISEGGNSCGFVNYILEAFWCGGHAYRLIGFEGKQKYLYYALKKSEKEIMNLRVGSGLPNVQKKNLSDFKTPMHQTSKKQEEVVKFLDSLTCEIDNLKFELAKYECIKQGMAHDLLTGKVRLV